MAGDWIKMQIGLDSSPEVIRLSDLLDISEEQVVGCLFRLWCWADQHTENGNAVGVTEKWVDRYISVTGFAEAMTNVGWLVASEEGLTIPNFDRHNGKSAKHRAKTNRRVADHRKRNGDSVTDRAQKALPEKRREEKIKKNNKKRYSPLFESFWEIWPAQRKQGKAAAFKAWEKAIKRERPDNIITAATNFSKSPKAHGEFCPQPSTWLNQERWLDHPDSWNDGTVIVKKREKSPTEKRKEQYLRALHVQLREMVKAGEGKTEKAEMLKKEIEKYEAQIG
jgi:hypothetical protein